MSLRMNTLTSAENKFGHLRKKLDQMGYLQPLGLESALLVEKILTDLLHATEGLHNYKEQKNILEEEKKTFEKQLEPFQAENAKLVKKNNELNIHILHQNEKFEETVKDLKTNLRKLEHENADLRFLNTQYYHKLKALERESQQKAEQLLLFQEKNLQATVQVKNVKKQAQFRRQKMEIDTLLPPAVPSEILNNVYEQTQDIYIIDMLKLADNRIIQLEEDNKKILNTLEEAEEALIDLQKQIGSRNKEIIRLKQMLDGGRPIDAIVSEAKHIANDNLVTSLHMQNVYKNKILNWKASLVKYEESTKFHFSNNNSNNKLKLQPKKVIQKQKSCGMSSKYDEIIKKYNELEKENQNLIMLLKSKDLEQINLEKLIKELEQEKEELQKKLNSMSSNEKDLVLEIGRLSHKNVDDICQRYSSDHLLQLISILEAQRDHYKEEVIALQNIQQYKNNNTEISKTTVKKNKKSSDKNEKQTKSEDNLLKLIEEERNYYKQQYLNLEENIKKQSNTLSNVEQIDKEVSAIDNELYRLREEVIELQTVKLERDQLKNRIKELEKLLEKNNLKFNAESDVRTEERIELESKVQILQDELEQEKKEIMWLRNEVVLAAKNPQQSTLDLILKRMTQEKDNISFELQQVLDERKLLQLKLQESNDKHSSEKRKLHQQIEDLKSTIIESEKQRNILETEVSSLKNLVSSLEEELINLQFHWSQLKDEHNITKAAADQMKLLADEGEASKTNIHSQFLLKEKELHSAKEKISSLQTNLDNLNEMIEQYNVDVSKYQTEIENLSKEKNQFQQLAEQKSQHLLSVQHEVLDKEEQMSQLRITINTLESQLDKLQSEIQDKEKLLQSIKQQLESNTEQFESFQHSQNIVQNENKKLLENIGVLTKENQILSKELEKVHSEKETLKRQIQEYVTEVTRVEELLAHKEQQRMELLEQYRSLNEENVQLETQTQHLASINSSTELEVLVKEKELKMCHDRISALEDEIETHLSAEQKYRSEVNMLNSSVHDLELELQHTQTMIRQLQQDLASTRSLCVQLDSTRDQLQRQKANDEAEKEQLLTQIQKLQEETKMLRSQISNERASVLNLEGVLTVSREKEFRNHLSVQELTAEVKLLRERLKENDERLEMQSKELASSRTKVAELEMASERLKRQVTNEKYEKEKASQELKRLRRQHQFFDSSTGSSDPHSSPQSLPSSSHHILFTRFDKQVQTSPLRDQTSIEKHTDFVYTSLTEVSTNKENSQQKTILIQNSDEENSYNVESKDSQK
ncbi:LOW QUALITY PROTEIN: centrosomal protein of 135 kDa-like [Centruroides vittatus]|uniref:LOW QUALITY PROTEIN: centrosomal protein of 135 kDa-like n=1 Tax=Centruroides vittatus TaxID=120091 RepID=UPI00350FBB4C